MDFAEYSSPALFDLFRENQKLRHDMLAELLRRISLGRCVYSRLLPTDIRGILTPIHYAGILSAERQICPSLHLLRPQEQIEDEIEEWAIENTCWMTEEHLRRESDCQTMFSKGTESVVYISKDQQYAIKMMHPREGYEVVSLGDMLDGVALYNMAFASVPYKVLGFGRNDAGVFCAICKQPLVIGKTLTKYAEQKGYTEQWVKDESEAIMLKRGFSKDQACWYKDQYVVTDITGNNVVRALSGHALVIDADVNYRDASFFGKEILMDL